MQSPCCLVQRSTHGGRTSATGLQVCLRPLRLAASLRCHRPGRPWWRQALQPHCRCVQAHALVPPDLSTASLLRARRGSHLQASSSGRQAADGDGEDASEQGRNGSGGPSPGSGAPDQDATQQPVGGGSGQQTTASGPADTQRQRPAWGWLLAAGGILALGAAAAFASLNRKPPTIPPDLLVVEQLPAPAEPLQPSQTYLFEPRYGLPVVRKYLKYGELLKEIRLEKVAEIRWFAQEEALEWEGPCLVVYKDGTVAQSYVPYEDTRVPYAMETHGVLANLLRPQPSDRIFDPPPSVILNAETLRSAVKLGPWILLAGVYAAATVAGRIKGDWDDRRKLRQAEAEEARAAKAAEREFDVAKEVEVLAGDGYDLQFILADLDKRRVSYDREEVEEIYNDVKATSAKQDASTPEPGLYNVDADKQREAIIEARKEADAAARRAQGGSGPSTSEDAAEFGQLRTVRLKKAHDPRKARAQRALREANMKTKGLKLQYVADEDVFFDDVAGIGDAKVELMEVVDFFLFPERFRRSGARVPRGVLLCGPPGTGKTLLARAVAGEAGVVFLAINASEFVEMFVGVGASRVRHVFNMAREQAAVAKGAIIFIDELDAVGRTRGGARGNDERDQTLNQILTEMDGFKDGSGVIVMAATNRLDVLDPALIRPGRFDRIITVDIPDFFGRIEILKVHLAKRGDAARLTEEEVKEIAFQTQRFSGAALANLVNLAAGFAAQEGRDVLVYADMLKALDYERLGPARAPYSDSRRRRLAVQEGATALVCTLLPAIEPVVYVTIRPREKFPLGQTVVSVNEQRELTHTFTRRYLEEQLLTVLAGRAAEELLYGFDEMSTLNQRRLMTARRIAQKLVVAAAMSDNPDIGPRTVSKPVALGETGLAQMVLSRVTAKTHEVADLEMERLLNDSYAQVKDLLERSRGALNAVVDALMDRSRLEGDELRALVEEHANPADLERRRQEAAPIL